MVKHGIPVTKKLQVAFRSPLRSPSGVLQRDEVCFIKRKPLPHQTTAFWRVREMKHETIA